MKRKTFTTALCCVCSLFAGCEQADDLNVPGGDLRMSLVAGIGQSASRYAGNSPNEIVFAANDVIGLKVNEEDFVQWEFDGAKWRTVGNAVYWEDKTSSHSFYAFYPYAANASLGNVPMPSLDGQDGSMAKLGKHDFLVASKIQSYGDDGTVSFTDGNTFTHVSSLISLTIKGGGDLNNASLSKISFRGTNLITSSTYSFEDKKITLVNENQDELSMALTNCVMNSGDKTFYFILNSGTVDLSAVTLSIHYTVDNVKYKAEKIGIQKDVNDKFESGKRYDYIVTIVDNSLKMTGNEIKDWEAGNSLGSITINGEKEETQS